jgi:hypothetical protein
VYTGRLDAQDVSLAGPSPESTEAGLTFRKTVTPAVQKRDPLASGPSTAPVDTRPGDTGTASEMTARTDTETLGATAPSTSSDHPFGEFPDTQTAVDHLYEAFQRRYRVDRERRGL